jgi:alpha-tubulin suppressor-like RCC1 family protein
MSYFKSRHLNRWNGGCCGGAGENGKAIRRLSRHVKSLVVVLLMLSALLLPPAAQVFAGVPTDGLVAWYPFDGNANDASGNGNNGALPAAEANRPALTYDQFMRPDHAYAFDGAVDAFDYITIPHSSSLSFSTGFSTSFWVNFNQASFYRGTGGYDWQGIFTKDDYTKFGLMLSHYNRTLRFYHAGLNPSQSDYVWSNVLPNTWYNVVITYDGDHTHFFVNGREKSSTAVTGSLAANSFPLYIGSSYNSGPYPFAGKMDTVSFYNRALTAQEVMDIYIDGAVPSLEAGDYHTCGVKTDGTIACWGAGTTNTGVYPHFGQSITPSGTFTQVSGGVYHTCGVKTDGTIACWGWNYYGQATTSDAGLFDQVKAGGYHTCGLKTDGSVACWGAGTTTGGFADYGQSIPLPGPFIQVSGGMFHTCGFKTDGSVACWGYNDYGEAPGSKDGPFTQVSAGGWHTCGVKADGTIACWGAGQTDTGWDRNYGQSIPPSGTFIQVSAGGEHTCGVRTDGTVACWGAGTTNTGVEPHYGQSIPPTGTFTQVSVGRYHTCGVKTDGTVICWGDNGYGQAPVVSISPTTLPNGTKDAVYSQALSASGGTGGPYAFSVTGGTLPPGISLSSGGTLSGTPTASGSYTFNVRAFDGTGLLGTSQEVHMAVKEYGSSNGVVSSTNPSAYGQSVTFTATITATPSGATGTVTFSDGATPICSSVALSGGQATCSTSTLTGGQHTITATYSGDDNYNGSSGTVEQTVTPATVSLSIAFAGAGGNKVDSTSPNNGINCLKGSIDGCSASFATGLPVTLSTTADWKSVFTGWSANAPAGVVSMDGDKTVTATFDIVNRAKLSLAGTLHASIQDACDAAASGDTILAQEYFFQEPQGVTIGPVTAKALTIKGGYAPGDGNYNTITGITTVLGPVNIVGGSLTAEGLAVR